MNWHSIVTDWMGKRIIFNKLSMKIEHIGKRKINKKKKKNLVICSFFFYWITAWAVREINLNNLNKECNDWKWSKFKSGKKPCHDANLYDMYLIFQFFLKHVFFAASVCEENVFSDMKIIYNFFFIISLNKLTKCV